MAELPSEPRTFRDRIGWKNLQNHPDPFPVGTVLVVLTLVLTIMAIFLSAQGQSGTGDGLRWGFFVLLVVILCLVAIRWIYPERSSYDEVDYQVELPDGGAGRGIDRSKVKGALDGHLFNQVDLMLGLREVMANRLMVRHRLSRADLRTAIDEDRLDALVDDIDLAWVLKGNARDFEELLTDGSNEVRANFFVWFGDMLRKVEEWR